jgi:RNase adaptor protein for sRNA GlmZ degradation
MVITATQIKQNSGILQKALVEDIVVTKREQPFVVIVEYDKYLEMEKLLERYKEERRVHTIQNAWLASAKESERVLDDDDESLYLAINAEAQNIIGRKDA